MSAGGFLFKVGTTFMLTADFSDSQLGVVENLAGAQLQAELRDSLDNLVAELTVSVDQTVQGRALISYSGSTSAWPLGQLRCDVLISWPDGSVQQTETFTITAIRGVTQPLITQVAA